MSDRLMRNIGRHFVTFQLRFVLESRSQGSHNYFMASSGNKAITSLTGNRWHLVKDHFKWRKASEYTYDSILACKMWFDVLTEFILDCSIISGTPR